MFILDEVKKMVEVDLGEEIYDDELNRYIINGLGILEQNNIPVPKNIQINKNEFGAIYLEKHHADIVLDYLHLYVISRFDRNMLTATSQFVENNMFELLLMLKSIYEKGKEDYKMDLTNYYTKSQSDLNDTNTLEKAKTYTNEQIKNVNNIDLTDYYKKAEANAVISSGDATTFKNSIAYTDKKVNEIPKFDVNNYYNKAEVEEKITTNNTNVLTESKNYTNQKISEIPVTDLTNYYTKEESNEQNTTTLSSANKYTDDKITSSERNTNTIVTSGDENTLKTAKEYTDEKIGEIPETDLSNYYKKEETDQKDGTVLESAKTYINNKILSGTTTPEASQGEDGSIYIQYTE